mmetsp:Transcript_1557/g.2952  ORF Transcript_1557/g.2952 Transcript_1557/m.2952 type:complete len:222 (+) Transcript_1557:759-1424(+)
MYFSRKRRWKSFRTVSLMKRFFFTGSPRVWFLNTTSSSHLRLTLKLAGPVMLMSGLPFSICSSFSFASFSSRCFSLRSCSSALSRLIRSSSRSNSAVSSSSSSSSSLSAIFENARCGGSSSSSSASMFVSTGGPLSLGASKSFLSRSRSLSRSSPRSPRLRSSFSRERFSECFRSLSSSSAFKSFFFASSALEVCRFLSFRCPGKSREEYARVPPIIRLPP